MGFIDQIIKDIDVFSGRDTASLDLFELAVEKEWGTRLLLAKEVYHSDQMLLDREITAELDRLDQVLQHYLDCEEFERCAKIQSLLEQLRTETGVDTFIAEYIKRDNIFL